MADNDIDKQVINRPGQFQPGQSGNPNGRPKKGYSITETIRSMMAEKPEIKQSLATKILSMALQGDLRAIQIVWQYMDGMPEQSVKNLPPDINVEDVKQQLRDSGIDPESIKFIDPSPARTEGTLPE